jgi:DNA invertase Pin-like site-specific DNA recombinase
MVKHKHRVRQRTLTIVTKLDRLGRNAIDVATTVDRLEKMGVRYIVWRWAVLT